MLFDIIVGLIQGDDPKLSLLNALFAVVALLLIFSVHEYAHGLMALVFGDSTAKEQGRLSLNPVDHLDVPGFVMLLLFGFGWAKPVQFDPRNFKHKRLGTIAVAAAGPLSNILFGFISYLIWAILHTAATAEWLILFSNLFLYMTFYNLSLAVFNLIPLPPLDGSKILGELLPLKWRIKYYELERHSYVLLIGLILFLNVVDIVEIFTDFLLLIFTPAVRGIIGGLFG